MKGLNLQLHVKVSHKNVKFSYGILQADNIRR